MRDRPTKSGDEFCGGLLAGERLRRGEIVIASVSYAVGVIIGAGLGGVACSLWG